MKRKKAVKLWPQVSFKLIGFRCACGCDKVPKGTRRDSGNPRKFFNASCRKRWHRAEEAAAKLVKPRRGRKVKAR